MRCWYLTIAVTLLLGPAYSAQADCLKNFCLDSSERGKFCASNIKGKVYLIDFWASWCPSCVQSLKWISDIEQSFPSSSFGFIGLNLDAHRADALALIKQFNLSAEIVFDSEGSQAEACGISGVPGTILLNREGTIVKRWNGFNQETQAEILAELEKLRGQQ